MAEPERPPEGAPATELGLAGGNIVALTLAALGGLWMWAALGLAGVGAGLIAWKARRRRQRRGGYTTRRRGVARSAALPGFAGGRRGSGRSSGRGAGRSGSSRAAGRPSGPGGARRPGLLSGRRKTAGAAGNGRPASAASKRAALGRTLRGRGKPQGAAAGGRRLRSPSTWLRGGTPGRTAAGRAASTRAGGRSAPGRGMTPGGRSTRRPNLHKADVVNTPTTRKTPKPPQATTPNRPPKKDPVPNPYSTTTKPQHTKGTSIMTSIFGKAWRENAEATHAKASRYDPERMPDYLDDLIDMAAAFETEARALGKIAAISEAELPVHPKLVAYLNQVQSTMLKVSADTQDVVKHFVKLHQADLDRHHQGRRGEQKWNVK